MHKKNCDVIYRLVLRSGQCQLSSLSSHQVLVKYFLFYRVFSRYNFSLILSFESTDIDLSKKVITAFNKKLLGAQKKSELQLNFRSIKILLDRARQGPKDFLLEQTPYCSTALLTFIKHFMGYDNRLSYKSIV